MENVSKTLHKFYLASDEDVMLIGNGFEKYQSSYM